MILFRYIVLELKMSFQQAPMCIQHVYYLTTPTRITKYTYNIL